MTFLVLNHQQNKCQVSQVFSLCKIKPLYFISQDFLLFKYQYLVPQSSYSEQGIWSNQSLIGNFYFCIFYAMIYLTLTLEIVITLCNHVLSLPGQEINFELNYQKRLKASVNNCILRPSCWIMSSKNRNENILHILAF